MKDNPTSAVNQGLPAPAEPRPTHRGPSAQGGQSGPSREPGTKTVDPHNAYVLVVEDNLQNLVLIARLLAFLGVQRYEWKASGWQVLEFADTMPRVDLVLMDIHLPYEDGYDALGKLRADARFKDTRVVAVTADANPASLEKARQAGFDGFLGKPIDPDRFPDQIRRVLQGEQVWEIGY